MEELILIDGNSLLFKAFYATSYTGNYMVNRNGIPTMVSMDLPVWWIRSSIIILSM